MARKNLANKILGTALALGAGSLTSYAQESPEKTYGTPLTRETPMTKNDYEASKTVGEKLITSYERMKDEYTPLQEKEQTEFDTVEELTLWRQKLRDLYGSNISKAVKLRAEGTLKGADSDMVKNYYDNESEEALREAYRIIESRNLGKQEILDMRTIFEMYTGRIFCKPGEEKSDVGEAVLPAIPTSTDDTWDYTEEDYINGPSKFFSFGLDNKSHPKANAFGASVGVYSPLTDTLFLGGKVAFDTLKQSETTNLGSGYEGQADISSRGIEGTVELQKHFPNNSRVTPWIGFGAGVRNEDNSGSAKIKDNNGNIVASKDIHDSPTMPLLRAGAGLNIGLDEDGDLSLNLEANATKLFGEKQKDIVTGARIGIGKAFGGKKKSKKRSKWGNSNYYK